MRIFIQTFSIFSLTLMLLFDSQTSHILYLFSKVISKQHHVHQQNKNKKHKCKIPYIYIHMHVYIFHICIYIIDFVVAMYYYFFVALGYCYFLELFVAVPLPVVLSMHVIIPFHVSYIFLTYFAIPRSFFAMQ